MFFLRF